MEPDPHRYRRSAPRAPEGHVDLDVLLPGPGPLEIDIGFGRGHSLFSRAEAAPDHRLLGVEVKTKWVCKVEERIEREQRPQMKVLAEDAAALFPRLGPDAAVTRFFMHFPDPWWKKRHHKRMLLTPSFLDEVARLLKAEGEFFVQTDVPSRAEAYLAVLRQHPSFRLQETEISPFLDDAPFASRSNRELRVEQDGLPVYRLLAKRLPEERGASRL